MNNVVELTNVEVAYGSILAVRGATFAVAEREIFALLGPSGCGKTSLLRAIAGFERPRRGSIRIGDTDVVSEGRWVQPEKRSVGMVFQEGALFPHLTLWENARYGVKREARGEEQAREALNLVGLLPLKDRYPHELSGGQQQRAALARAIAPRPKVVLLDEPFASLDPALRRRIRDDLREILHAARMTAILVTHDQEEALDLADRVAMMDRGRILQVGTPAEIYDSPARAEVAMFVGEGECLSCRIGTEILESLLGPAARELEGDAKLFIRPEDLEVAEEGDPRSVPAVVETVRFFGHDVLHSIRLEGADCRLPFRTMGTAALRRGSTLRIRLRSGRYGVFIGSDESQVRREIEVG
ncbi:MAG TPA: ABC transporter ATP-binding protein [Thermoanaerobaculia bacterium]|nr:ABC transporter ATP-binding protein [Thermoanaerobaculia bacterium]